MSILVAPAGVGLLGNQNPEPSDPPVRGGLHWRVVGPLVEPQDVAGISTYSIKDPSIVRHQDRWHLFCTIRGQQRSHAIVYLSFGDWEDARTARHHVLPIHPGFFCAPQVFYFTPHKRWYMICQASSDQWKPEYQPAPRARPRIAEKPEKFRLCWLDFRILPTSRTWLSLGAGTPHVLSHADSLAPHVL